MGSWIFARRLRLAGKCNYLNDSVDIVNSKDLRQDLIDFYQKEYMNACKYCILTDIQVQPALQQN